MSNKNTDLDFININSEYKKQAEPVLNKLNKKFKIHIPFYFTI